MTISRESIKIIIVSVFFYSCVFFCSRFSFAAQEALEIISYEIKPIGTCEYQDFGPIEFQGKKANLIIFKTLVTGFKDKEVIISEPQKRLPILVRRDISILFHKENITEEYFPSKNSFKLTKFEGGKKVEEYYVKGNGPIQNAILMPFSLRGNSELKVGSSFKVILPGEYTVKLSSIEEVTVPAGKFKTYHFTSTPEKFEIWISADDLRIPVKIKGLGAFPYTMEMKSRVAKQR
ncbi:MAG: hypothetical protein Q7K98_08160 [Candidatus Omnitrophota bacterium]|nr:hypothetical protein [Candidatus Omnitrophota bacterium]